MALKRSAVRFRLAPPKQVSDKRPFCRIRSAPRFGIRGGPLGTGRRVKLHVCGLVAVLKEFFLVQGKAKRKSASECDTSLR
jgi:hypothetical protein